jgi:hypothetical protein
LEWELEWEWEWEWASEATIVPPRFGGQGWAAEAVQVEEGGVKSVKIPRQAVVVVT